MTHLSAWRAGDRLPVSVPGGVTVPRLYNHGHARRCTRFTPCPPSAGKETVSGRSQQTRTQNCVTSHSLSALSCSPLINLRQREAGVRKNDDNGWLFYGAFPVSKAIYMQDCIDSPRNPDDKYYYNFYHRDGKANAHSLVLS